MEKQKIIANLLRQDAESMAVLEAAASLDLSDWAMGSRFEPVCFANSRTGAASIIALGKAKSKLLI